MAQEKNVISVTITKITFKQITAQSKTSKGAVKNI